MKNANQTIGANQKAGTWIFGLLLSACCAAILVAPARAEGLPACDDAQMVGRVEKYYRFSDDDMGGGFRALKDVKETGTGKEVTNFHKYLTETSRIDGVRYCEATAVLGDGKTDTIYYRIPDMVDGDKHSYDPDICSTRIFTFLGECEDFRAK